MSQEKLTGKWKHWSFLSGDISWEEYGGKWIRKDPSAPRVYYVIEHMDWFEHDESYVKETGGDRYLDTVYRVDLDEVPPQEIQSALRSCGPDTSEEWFQKLEGESLDHVLVESLQSYGIAAPMGEYSSNRALSARAQPRDAANEMIRDSDRANELLDRPVNKIGSTARDFQRGDITAGLKKYQAILQIQEDQRPADFLPYFMGYQDGLAGREKETCSDPDDSIVPEYFQGYERGVLVRTGKASPPPWIKVAK